MIAGADSIEDMAFLRHGAMGRLFTGARAPSTFGTFLRTFMFGHVRQLDAVVSRLLIGLSGSAPLLAGAGQLAYLDVDDTVQPTFGYAKHCAGRGYTGVKGPLPAGQAEICARGRPSVGTFPARTASGGSAERTLV